MSDIGIDDVLDEIPQRLRNEVLRAWQREDLNTRLPWSYTIWAALGFVWAVPWFIVGVAFCATLIGIVPGIFLIGVGCIPLNRLVRRIAEVKTIGR